MRPKDEMELAPRTPDVIAQLIELAKDPAIDVVKIEKLIDANERLMRIQAKASFDAAFADMQGELPAITEQGEIKVNGDLRSRYAKYEDIIEVIRPILQKHGFAIRHRNEMNGNVQTIVGILSHRGGHSEEDRFDCPPDKSGGKQDIQAIGSTRSYGQRYTTISLCNIVTKGQDKDGQATKETVTAPAGYDDWRADMEIIAKEKGLPALSAAFSASKSEYRTYMNQHHRPEWEKTKAHAATVKAVTKEAK